MRSPALALAVVVVGCGGPPPRPAPAAAVAELALALEARDGARLAAISGRSEAEVLAADADAGRELAALGHVLARTPVDESARVVLSDGSSLVLVRDGEAWRVDRGVLGRPALTRPEDAVLALHGALARSRLEGVVALLARGPRSEMSSELARWLEATADPDALEVSVEGDTALVVTPTGERIELVRESGEWRLVELR